MNGSLEVQKTTKKNSTPPHKTNLSSHAALFILLITMIHVLFT